MKRKRDGGDAVKCLWIFILAPLVGGAAAAGVSILFKNKLVREDNEGSSEIIE